MPPSLKSSDLIPDGYTWLKSGEKKNESEDSVRSYFKCAHKGCLAKRIVI